MGDFNTRRVDRNLQRTSRGGGDDFDVISRGKVFARIDDLSVRFAIARPVYTGVITAFHCFVTSVLC